MQELTYMQHCHDCAINALTLMNIFSVSCQVLRKIECFIRDKSLSNVKIQLLQ